MIQTEYKEHIVIKDNQTERFTQEVKQKITLVGIGMGTLATLTEGAKAVITSSDLLIGAKRMLEGFESLHKAQFVSYLPREIAAFIKAHPHYQNIAILLSGDVGFYSGAKGLLDVLNDYEVELIPGISSLLYFCAKLKMPWEDVKLSSVHGKAQRLIPIIKRQAKTFALLNGGESLKALCEKLIYYGMDQVVLHIGERLSYKEERILHLRPGEIEDFNFDPLLVVLIENPSPELTVFEQIRDEDFIRGDVPMTKSEVRTVSIAKLGITRDAVIYDIGAGTGSVSIELARKSPYALVYAIEKNEKALKLIEENKRKFGTDNLEIISGEAPEVLADLPAPTHVFIGGSSGNLRTILSTIFEKNSEVKVVMNTVSLNSLTEVMNLTENSDFVLSDIVQMNIAKAKQLGKYQMMMGQNPIYVITIEKRGE